MFKNASEIVSSLPSRIDCRIANPDLWKVFLKKFEQINKLRPTASWSEEEVTQWLDFNEEPDTLVIINEEDIAQEKSWLRAL